MIKNVIKQCWRGRGRRTFMRSVMITTWMIPRLQVFVTGFSFPKQTKTLNTGLASSAGVNQYTFHWLQRWNDLSWTTVDLTQCKNWPGICSFDYSSVISNKIWNMSHFCWDGGGGGKYYGSSEGQARYSCIGWAPKMFLMHFKKINMFHLTFQTMSSSRQWTCFLFIRITMSENRFPKKERNQRNSLLFNNLIPEVSALAVFQTCFILAGNTSVSGWNW